MAAGTTRTPIPQGKTWTLLDGGAKTMLLKVPKDSFAVEVYYGLTASPPGLDAAGMMLDGSPDHPLTLVLGANDSVWVRRIANAAVIEWMVTA